MPIVKSDQLLVCNTQTPCIQSINTIYKIAGITALQLTDYPEVLLKKQPSATKRNKSIILTRPPKTPFSKHSSAVKWKLNAIMSRSFPLLSQLGLKSIWGERTRKIVFAKKSLLNQ